MQLRDLAADALQLFFTKVFAPLISEGWDDSMDQVFKKGWMWHLWHGLVDKVVLCHRLEMMISKVFSNLADSVILQICDQSPALTLVPW